MKKFLLLSLIISFTNLLFAQSLSNNNNEAAVQNIQTIYSLYSTDDLNWTNLKSGTATPSVNIVVNDVSANIVTATFTPNNNCSSFKCMIGEEAVMEQWANQYNVSIDELVSSWGFSDTEENTHIFNDLIPSTEYVLYARPFDSENTAYPMDTIHIKTSALGGNNIANIQIEISEITDSSIVMTVIPNEETAVFHDGLITKELFDQIEQDSAIQIIQNNNYPLYNIDNWTWNGLQSGTIYKAIAIGKNALDEWGNTTIVEFSTLFPTNILNITNENFKIYPQPNNGNFIIETQTIKNKTIKIYDLNARLVHEEPWINNQQEINAKHLKSGTYFMQTELGKTPHKLIITK